MIWPIAFLLYLWWIRISDYFFVFQSSSSSWKIFRQTCFLANIWHISWKPCASLVVISAATFTPERTKSSIYMVQFFQFAGLPLMPSRSLWERERGGHTINDILWNWIRFFSKFSFDSYELAYRFWFGKKCFCWSWMRRSCQRPICKLSTWFQIW